MHGGVIEAGLVGEIAQAPARGGVGRERAQQLHRTPQALRAVGRASEPGRGRLHIVQYTEITNLGPPRRSAGRSEK